MTHPLNIELLQIAAAEPGSKFFGKPDRWYDDFTVRCINNHISSGVIKSEEHGDMCPRCMGPCWMTYPEDQDGPLKWPEGLTPVKVKSATDHPDKTPVAEMSEDMLAGRLGFMWEWGPGSGPHRGMWGWRDADHLEVCLNLWDYGSKKGVEIASYITIELRHKGFDVLLWESANAHWHHHPNIPKGCYVTVEDALEALQIKLVEAGYEAA